MPDADPNAQPTLEGGAYEIIRSRLEKHGADLRVRLDKLNADRQEVFGAVPTALIATERITTSNNCVPRDMIAIGGGRFIFGYNVHIGLRSTTAISDVFAFYEHDAETHAFSEKDASELLGGDFLTDFDHLYKYYKETIFAKFMVIGPHLYMAFRVGKDVTDIKAFKWRRPNDGTLEYLGNRFDHEYLFPPQQEFEWKRAHRDMHRGGEFPHISIEDRVFVETVGGDLTIKIEDNTASGEGIYREDVTEPDQTLDDAEIFYALVGSLILLKIRPYQEKLYRNLIFNEKTQTVTRVDAIEHSCVLLPDDHGIIFSDGYYLQSGEHKIFGNRLKDMLFERRIASPNGEDYLHVFYNRRTGLYILLSYNIIQQQVETPIICNGYSLFANGELVYFKCEDEPQKHHTLQVWQTPFVHENIQPHARTDSYLYKVGNADIVRCMAECQEILNLIGKNDSYAGLYLDLVKKAGDVADAYFWIAKEEAQNLKVALVEIKGAAQAAIGEFDKVRRLRLSTKAETDRVTKKAAKLVNAASHAPPDDIMGFVHYLAELRAARGEAISLRDLRYSDPEHVDKLEASLGETTERISQHCVEFLLKPEALDPYRGQVEEQRKQVPKVAKTIEADEVEKALNAGGGELEMLIDIVGNLKIADSTQTTQIIDDVSTIYATLNQVRVELKSRRRELSRSEGVAQFGAQIKLLNQAVVNYLDLCGEPDKCDEYLSKVMIQLEELEGKFSEFDEYVAQLGEKREEIYNAFESRKVALVESRNKRTGALQQSAERILTSVRRRLDGLKTINEINGYLASDLMIEKIRDVIRELTALGDSVKADDLQTKLKATREDAVRQLKDRQELFVDCENIIRFGKHQFSVNTQPLELTVVRRNDAQFYHLTGTNFFERIDDPAFDATREVWDQEVVSENNRVYRSEYLAWQYLQSGGGLTESLREDVQRFMAPRYAEGYVKGVHDEDAARILAELLRIHEAIGLLRYAPEDRALGLLFWEQWNDAGKEALAARIRSYGTMSGMFAGRGPQVEYVKRLESEIARFCVRHAFLRGDAVEAAAYLFDELVDETNFTVSREAADILHGFKIQLTERRMDKKFAAAGEALGEDVVGRFEIASDWLTGYGASAKLETQEYVAEAAAHLVRGGHQKRDVVDVLSSARIEGMTGSHPLIVEGSYDFHYNHFVARLRAFEVGEVPRFECFVALKKTLVEKTREAMRLGEFKPRVMTSFVRNKLIDEVYLPIIGDNLAKQIGTVGSDTRTDRMGLLLLVSPPGYGKTTLMEYIANRLGITFMKINGPAIGHQVTSLDPTEAPNASAREEVQKLNLALEMGDNVMIYLDDIQHCNTEFLQKFISLCDGQRKMEGVYKGKARTYDLRGKKVAVVMAGNPYTESGGRFQIPDMLANRADTYNLGDIVGGNASFFETSYIENALTSNPVLGKMASRSQADVYTVLKIAATGSREGADFEGNYTVEEIEEMVAVTKKLMRVRDTILRVNQEYIRSAAQQDAYRTEPSFKLQGSYRNMNRIAEKILALMTAEEVEIVIRNHYENESQTLTADSEANLLKFYELESAQSEKQAARWEQIKKAFNKQKLLGGAEGDPVSRVVAQMSGFTEGLEKIEDILRLGQEHQAKPATLADETVSKLERIIANIRAVPVDVEIKVVPVHDGEDAAPEANVPEKLPVDVKSRVRQKVRKDGSEG